MPKQGPENAEELEILFNGARGRSSATDVIEMVALAFMRKLDKIEELLRG